MVDIDNAWSFFVCLFVTEEIQCHGGLWSRELGQSPMLLVFLTPRQQMVWQYRLQDRDSRSNCYTIIHPKMKPSDPLLLADGTLLCGSISQTVSIWGFATFSLSCSKYYCSKLIDGLNRRPLEYKGNALAVTPRRRCFIGHPFSIDFKGRQLYLLVNLMVRGIPTSWWWEAAPQVDGERRPPQLMVRGGPYFYLISWWWEAAPQVDGERRPLKLMVRGGPHFYLISWWWEAAPPVDGERRPPQLMVRGGPHFYLISWRWEGAPQVDGERRPHFYL